MCVSSSCFRLSHDARSADARCPPLPALQPPFVHNPFPWSPFPFLLSPSASGSVLCAAADVAPGGLSTIPHTITGGKEEKRNRRKSPYIAPMHTGDPSFPVLELTALACRRPRNNRPSCTRLADSCASLSAGLDHSQFSPPSNPTESWEGAWQSARNHHFLTTSASTAAPTSKRRIGKHRNPEEDRKILFPRQRLPLALLARSLLDTPSVTVYYILSSPACPFWPSPVFSLASFSFSCACQFVTGRGRFPCKPAAHRPPPPHTSTTRRGRRKANIACGSCPSAVS